MIEVKNITKQYGEKKVVDNISFQIPKNKVTSFIGPNGAGKSTLLSIVSRILKRDAGEVYIEGKELSEWDSNDLAKKVAFMKQTNNVNIRLKVEELVAFGRFPYSKGRLNEEDKQKVNEAIAYMELEDIRGRFLDELSGGQRQRAYIAMTIAQDTDYILLDEPLNNLDIKYCVQIMNIIRKLVDELGKTVVIVIHDINFASFYSDYILSIKDGRECYIDEVKQVVTKEKLERLYETECEIINIKDKNLAVYY